MATGVRSTEKSSVNGDSSEFPESSQVGTRKVVRRKRKDINRSSGSSGSSGSAHPNISSASDSGHVFSFAPLLHGESPTGASADDESSEGSSRELIYSRSGRVRRVRRGVSNISRRSGVVRLHNVNSANDTSKDSHSRTGYTGDDERESD